MLLSGCTAILSHRSWRLLREPRRVLVVRSRVTDTYITITINIEAVSQLVRVAITKPGGGAERIGTHTGLVLVWTSDFNRRTTFLPAQELQAIIVVRLQGTMLRSSGT